MIRSCLLSALFIIMLKPCADGQGKYAGDFKNLIGKTYTDDKEVPGLKGFPCHEATMVSDMSDPQQLFLNVYIKGATGVVVFSVKEDSSEKEFHVVDVIGIKGIPKGYEINTTTCREGETEGQILVALVKSTTATYAGPVKKVWRCNRDKLRFETMSIKGVKCLNEAGD